MTQLGSRTCSPVSDAMYKTAEELRAELPSEQLVVPLSQGDILDACPRVSRSHIAEIALQEGKFVVFFSVAIGTPSRVRPSSRQTGRFRRLALAAQVGRPLTPSRSASLE
jgi:hypothetical protein